MKYRAEIDGLRALAVVPVILFHAGFGLFSGGFVGVDVFFVISGYLITTILIEDIENHRFSIINFYERRARRILPALYFMLLTTLIVAAVIMSPQQLKDFGQSLLATSTFTSNIYFFLKIDYWAQSSDFIPLLHTWSLAVEEQYYLIFPIFLILAWRFGKNRVFWIIVVITSISLLLSEWSWRNNAIANFYLAPMRAWELLAGSIAAFIVQKHSVQKNNPLAILGLVLVIFSIFAYNENTPFPSVYTLLPVMGVVLLILYAEKETLAARLLSTKLFVGIGLISYSAYLWHQPLLALFRVLQNEIEISLLSKIIITAFTIFLAILSLKYVERPFRNKGKFSSKTIFYCSIVPLIIFIFIGYYLHKSEGLRQFKMSLLPPQMVKYLDFLDAEIMSRKKLWQDLLREAEAPYNNTKKIRLLFIGDSLSQDLYVVSMNSKLIESLVDSRRLAFDVECVKHIATRKLEVNHDQKLCKNTIDSYLNSSLFQQAEVVVVALAWLSNTQYISDLLNHALLKDKRVVLYQSHGFADITSIIYSIEESNSFSDNLLKFIFKSKRSRTVFANEEVEKFARARNIPTLNSFDAFCDSIEKRCHLFNERKQPYIIDQAHLSVTGINVFEKWFSKELINIFEKFHDK